MSVAGRCPATCRGRSQRAQFDRQTSRAAATGPRLRRHCVMAATPALDTAGFTILCRGCHIAGPLPTPFAGHNPAPAEWRSATHRSRSGTPPSQGGVKQQWLGASMQRARHPFASIDRRLIRDFVAAFLAFLAFSFAVGGGATSPAPHSPPARSATAIYAALPPSRLSDAVSPAPTYDQPAAWPAFEPPPTLAVILVLAAMFAAFVTFNLAVVRHLRCVSASPRRRSWRGG